MLSAQENEAFCRIGGDAPMGQLMRRHWIPAVLSEQVAEADDRPVRLQLLEGKPVAFRDSARTSERLDASDIAIIQFRRIRRV